MVAQGKRRYVDNMAAFDFGTVFLPAIQIWQTVSSPVKPVEREILEIERA